MEEAVEPQSWSRKLCELGWNKIVSCERMAATTQTTADLMYDRCKDTARNWAAQIPMANGWKCKLSSMFQAANLLLSGSASLKASNPSGLIQIPSHAHVQVDLDPNSLVWPWRVFKSSPYTPPNMTITTYSGELAEGLLFMTPQTINISVPREEENGGFIMDNDNEMVYALNISGITNFRLQHYKGDSYLTYWSGFNTDGANVGHGYGQVNFIDTEYRHSTFDPDLNLNRLIDTKIANWSIDIHEHNITPRDTLLVSAYNNTPWDLTPYGGPKDGWIADSLIFELDLETWEILYTWRASDHVPLTESRKPVITTLSNATEGAPWDWFHVNSIQLVGDDYLVTARHCWTVYLVSGEDGHVIWTLDGETGGDFGPLPVNGTFRWQHFARAHNVTASGLDLSMFDNHDAEPETDPLPSAALVLHLELPASKSYSPELLRRIETPSQDIIAGSQGDYIPELSNGNQLVGYGQIPITREYGPGPDGSDLRWQAEFGDPDVVQNYRAFKDIWHATPADWDPNLVVEDGYAYVSWNGATEVTEWNVYTAEDGAVKAVAAKKGFETVFKVPADATVLQVGAVQHGLEVRKSNLIQI